CVNSLIVSMLYHAKPSEVGFIMIDPKMVELKVYEGIPHLLYPVVTDPKKAASALNWAVNEMVNRYKKFADMNVRDLKGYNQKIDEEIEAGNTDVGPKMKQIVIIVDELADLMMTSPKEVEEAIFRLAQMARAAGLHLVIVTQRPSVNVVTGTIKANIPSRIALKVASGVDSRTILDMNGAEKLIGWGDMLYYPSGAQKPVRVQGCFISDEEVTEITEFLQKMDPDDAEEREEIEIIDVASADAGTSGGGGGNASDGADELYVEIGRFVTEAQKPVSIGLLQRKFRIGFNRAARIVDQLADEGVLSADMGDKKPREVLMSAEEFRQIYG
ncbi:MAG: DNA translocase FtsK, partial [Lachnospiraceae bacterium]|nr:DNA translocase FtsK [Lachnospiraceae bacterium]